MHLSIWPVAVPPTGMSVGHCIKASMLGETITEYANPDDTRLGLGRKAQSAFETSGLRLTTEDACIKLKRLYPVSSN